MRTLMQPVLSFFLMTFGLMAWASDDSPHAAVQTALDNLLVKIEEGREYAEADPQRFYTEVESVLEPFIDFDTIARRVMARYYQAATPEQRTRFATVFRDSLVKTYTKGLLQYNNEQITVTPERQGDRRGNRARVQMVLRAASGTTYPILYSMVQGQDARWLVENVTVNGVNIGLTFRNQFAHSVRSNQGDLDATINGWSAEIGGESGASEGAKGAASE